MVCTLDRDRHKEMIRACRAAGARIMLLGDGDVSGVIAVSQPEAGVDIYMGSGGAPEGVLAAAALRDKPPRARRLRTRSPRVTKYGCFSESTS